MAMDHSWITIFQIANEDRNVALCQLAAVSRRSSPLRQRFLGKEKVPGSNPGGGSVPAGLAALGAIVRLLPSRNTGSAYSYIFRAHRQWG